MGRSKTLLLFGVLLALVGVFVAARLHRAATTTTTRVVTRTIRPAASDLTTRKDQVGLVAADWKYMQRQDAISRQRALPSWTLGYSVASTDPSKAQVLNWVLAIVDRQAQWSSVTTKFSWDGQRWVPGGITFIQPLGTAPNGYDKFAPFVS